LRHPANRFAARIRDALHLEGRVVATPTGFEGRLTGTVGPDERRASVTFTTEDGKAVAVFAVHVFTAPLIRLTLESPWTRLAKLLRLKQEIEVGDPVFDDLFLVEVASPAKARDALARGAEVRRRIVEAFTVRGVTKLIAGRPNLSATVPLDALRKSEDYAILLDLLAATARAFDRVNIAVKVLGGERLALAGVHGQPRCAYCHAAVTGEEPDLVACDRCGTVLHEACWSELGRCPLLGCEGDVERARAPA
jgi:hypothetical protein